MSITLSLIRAQARPLGLFGVLLVALAAEMPWVGRGLRTRGLQAAVVLIYTLIVAAGQAPGRSVWGDARRGPNPWLLGLLAWAGVSACLAPFPAFAAAEALRLALGSGVYFAAAFVLRPGEQALLPLLLLGLGAAVGVYGLVQFGESGAGVFASDGITSVFGNHEQLGSLLALLLPPGLALALDRRQPPARLLSAQGASVLIGAALLLARTRSAWIGVSTGLLLLIFLSLRHAPGRSSRGQVVGPALLVALAFAALLTGGELAPLVSHRAATLLRAGGDVSLNDRLHRWRAACRMASERPVAGWGLGAWPVIEGRWTHQGDDVSEVLSGGTGHSNLAHDFWVQWAAETGGVGLALQAAFLAAFFVSAGRALPGLGGERRTLLLGCLAGVGAGAVDMIGAPSYTFPGVSSLFFVLLGLGVGAMRDSSAAGLPTRPGERLLPAGVGLAAALAVVGLGDRLRAEGRGVPRGTLTVTAAPSGPAPAGTPVQWVATYQAPDGSLRPTAPGTVWAVTEGLLDTAHPLFVSINGDPQRSGWQGALPAGIPEVTVTARYWDNFSREYDVSRTVKVH